MSDSSTETPKTKAVSDAFNALRIHLGESVEDYGQAMRIYRLMVAVVQEQLAERVPAPERWTSTIVPRNEAPLSSVARKAAERALQGFGLLQFEVRSDPDYAWSWHCNLAMSIRDALHCGYVQANEAAAALMRQLFRFDSKATRQWVGAYPDWQDADAPRRQYP